MRSFFLSFFFFIKLRNKNDKRLYTTIIIIIRKKRFEFMQSYSDYRSCDTQFSKEAFKLNSKWKEVCRRHQKKPWSNYNETANMLPLLYTPHHHHHHQMKWSSNFGLLICTYLYIYKNSPLCIWPLLFISTWLYSRLHTLKKSILIP